MEMMRYKTVIRFLFSTGIFFQACESDVSCRNDDGKEVDWYILYKLPNMNDGGLSYLYMDESSNGWTRSRETINSNSGTLAHTLKPLLDFYDRETEGFGYLLYNDQPPKPKKPAPASFGHSKGVVMLDRQTGVWLSHSTPTFPTYRSKDFWPRRGNANAQTFICVTYSYATFKQIGLQLQYIHAYSYDSRITTTFPTELRGVALRTCYPKRKPWFRIMTLTSVKGQRFTSFAKYRRFGDDIYSGLIVNSVKKDLYVKSWGRMRGPLPSNCSIPHHVYNVKKVQLPGTLPFTNTVDHSKWSVTADGGWTCIADMNREMSQMRRGGGAICINDAVIDIYTGWVAQVLDADLLVESWQRQGHDLPSNCSLPKHVMNIKRVHLPGSLPFKSYHDHSKWCVSQGYDDDVTCLGDMNREMTQLKRGGGLICSLNPLIYRAFRQAVDWYIGC